MTPADVVAVMPDDEEIWRAARAACALTGGSAIDMLNGVGEVRARYYAALALAFAYPTAPRLTLARKLGLPSALMTVRAELRRQAAWFDLAALNAVRAACGRPAMTREEARDAPLTWCGRPWTDLLPEIQSSKPDADPPEATGGLLPKKGADAGPSAETAPANIQSSDGRAEGRALEGPTERLLKDSQDTGSRSDGQARSEGSGTPGLSQQVREPSPAVLKGRVAARTEDLGGEVAEPVVEPGPSDAGMTTHGALNAVLEPRKAGFAKETKPMRVAPTEARRPSFGGVGCLGLTGAVDLNYRPDPPPEKRGVVLKTAELMGDPTPQQRARMRATPGVEPSRNYVGRGKW